MLKINEYSSVDEQLIKQWNLLWEQSPKKTFFNSYNWYSICMQIFKYETTIIITIEDDNKLIALLPLVKKKKYLVSPGEKYLDSTTLLINDKYEKVLSAIINYAKIKKYHIILNEIEEELVNKTNNTLKEYASNNPYSTLNVGLKNIIKPKELRYLKRIKEKNKQDLCFEFYKGEKCYKQIDRIFKIEKSSSKPLKKKDLFNNDKAINLFKEISKTDNSLLVILKYNNIDIAHLFSINCDETIMAYHMAFNKNYYYLQPGKLIFLELMYYMIENNFKILDFSRGDSVLKRHFSNGNIVKYNLYINCNILIKIKVYINNNILKMKKTKVYQKIKKIIKKK